MPRYAQVHEQYRYVANVVMWDGNEETWQPPAGYEMVEDVNNEAAPGFTYDENADPKFIPPPGV